MYSARKKSQGASNSRHHSLSTLKPAGSTKGIGVASLKKNNKMLTTALEETRSDLNAVINFCRQTLDESSKCLSQFKFARSKMLQMNSVLKSFVQEFEEVLSIFNLDDSELFQTKPPSHTHRTFTDLIDKIADLPVTSEEPSIHEELESEPVVSKNENAVEGVPSSSTKEILPQTESIPSSSKSLISSNEASKDFIDVKEAETKKKILQSSSPVKTSEVGKLESSSSSPVHLLEIGTKVGPSSTHGLHPGRKSEKEKGNSDELSSTVYYSAVDSKSSIHEDLNAPEVSDAQGDSQKFTNPDQLTAANMNENLNKNLTADSDSADIAEAQRSSQMFANAPETGIQSPSKVISSTVSPKMNTFAKIQKTASPVINDHCIETLISEGAFNRTEEIENLNLKNQLTHFTGAVSKRKSSDNIFIDSCNKKQKVKENSTKELKAKKKKGKKISTVDKDTETYSPIMPKEDIRVDVLHCVKKTRFPKSALPRKLDFDAITQDSGKKEQKKKTKRAKVKTCSEYSENVSPGVSNNKPEKINEVEKQGIKRKKYVSRDNKDSPYVDKVNVDKENKLVAGMKDLRVVLHDFRKSQNADYSNVPNVMEPTAVDTDLPVKSPLLDSSLNIQKLADKNSENVIISKGSHLSKQLDIDYSKVSYLKELPTNVGGLAGTSNDPGLSVESPTKSKEYRANEITLVGKRRRKPVNYKLPRINTKMRR